MYTPSQERAMEKMLSGESVYLAGAAGVGKSFLLNAFISKARESGKNVMVTAPTGIAALNVGGSTVHSALGWPKLGKKVHASDALIETDVLVVDEISMCRIDLFDHIVKKLDAANVERSKDGKKDIQLICVGDFAQLPPVVKNEDKDYLQTFFPGTSGYAFEHPRWRLPIVQLTEVVRQRDPEFATALNRIRLGDARGLDYINKNRSNRSIKDGIWVLATNKKVQTKNRNEINRLKGERKTYAAYTTGEYEEPTDKHLTLVENCRVVSLINQNGYLNGSLGTVVECGESYVSVAFDNGVIADVERHKWETKKPTVVEGEDGSKHLSEEVIGTFEQIPLKPAYAVTIHKSQGQTYEGMNADPYCFAPGQLYVELSRAESIEGLYLTREISEEDLKVDPKVVNFYRDSSPVTVANVDFSNEPVTPVKAWREDPAEREDREDAKEKETSAIVSSPKRGRRGRKMNDKDKREVASDTITTRATPTTKEAYERVMESMPGENRTEKFKNLIRAVENAAILTEKTGSDREDYENFLLYTTRLAESYSELLKQKSELADKIRLEYQTELSGKDLIISDLQKKVVEKEEQIKSDFEEKKDLADRIKTLEMVAQEVETAREKAALAEESLKDSRLVCANLQEKLIKLEEENAGYDDLKWERDDLAKDKEKLSERLDERTTEIQSLKNSIADLDAKLEKERAEHIMELGRAHKDALEEQKSVVKEAREDERKYWRGEIDRIQNRLDQERGKREDLEKLKLEYEFKIIPTLEALKKENSKMKKQLEEK